MKNPMLHCALVTCVVAFAAGELAAQEPTTSAIKRSRFNEVFVKVFVPVTKQTPKQNGPAVESWIEKELSRMGVADCFAVTNWVPVCDGLLADEIVDNDVWDGRLKSEYRYCPVGGDIPERGDGRVKVLLTGWDPGGTAMSVILPDEPGSRTIGKVDEHSQEQPQPYVAVLIGPPPVRPPTATLREN